MAAGWTGGLVLVAVVAGLSRAALPSAAGSRAGGQEAQGSADAAAATFYRVCGDCHDLQTVTASRRERTQWEEVIVEMIAEGARVSDDEFTVVLDYLLKHHGRVNVNRAEASELVAVLGLTESDAGRIVSHRKSHGAFPDFEALVKVPQVDVERLKAQRNAIAF
jgi:hypothetical protein